MKTMVEKTLKVTYVKPETAAEDAEIKRIIKEVKEEEKDWRKFDWKASKPGEILNSK